MDAEIQRYIKEQIKLQLNIILNGATGANDPMNETINELFPGMPAINSRPVMHPFGFVSRATQGTINVVAKVGADIQNRMVLGHRDKARPTDIEEGEVIIYSVGDYRIKVSKTKLMVGKGTDYEVFLVGETTQAFLAAFILETSKHQHLGNLGFQTSPPLDVANFLQLKADYLDNNKILAQDGGRF